MRDPLDEAGEPDEVLAAGMARIKPPVPVEKIYYVDYLATALSYNTNRISLSDRVVKLECGHTAITKNTHRAPCKTCHEMIMTGRDYEGFRRR